MFGLSNASTMATVWPAPPELLSLYALCRSAGPNPDGSALGAAAGALRPTCTRSVRRSAVQDAKPGACGAAQDRTTFVTGVGAAADAPAGAAPMTRPAALIDASSTARTPLRICSSPPLTTLGRPLPAPNELPGT